MKNYRYIILLLKILSITALFVMFYHLITTFPELPEQIEKHWDFKGNADQWGSKYNFLTIPIISIAVYLLFEISIKIESKKYKHYKSYPIFELSLRLLLFVILVFSTSHVYLQSYKYLNPKPLIDDINIVYSILAILLTTAFVVRQGIKLNNDHNS